MDPAILRNRIGREEFDYEALLSALGGLAYPRDAVTKLLRKSAVVRVKKGIYVFGEVYRRRPYSRELLANMAYGPSYISLEYALQHHGLMPERVDALTSVTTGGSREFHTPLGLFSYRQVPEAAFRVGFRRVEEAGEIAYLLAVPEKALADKVQADRGMALLTQADVAGYLTESLRMEESDLSKMNSGWMEELAQRYRSRRLLLLSQWLRRLRRRN